MATYKIGQTIRLSLNVQVSAVDTDPDVLLFRIMSKNGVTDTTYTYVTDAQVVKDSTGDFHVDWTIVTEGLHQWRFYNTSGSTAKGAAWQSFIVSDSLFV